MKFLLSILLASTLTGIIDNIAAVNRLKKEAEEAFRAKEYATAIDHYKVLLDSFDVKDENIRTNLAHAYLMSGDTAAAQQNYTQLINSEDKQIKSLAYQQMGVVNADQKKYKEALSFFKESLKADPTNEEARYNYELVKKLLKEQEQNQQQNKDQQKQDQNDKKEEEKDQQQKDEQNQQGDDQKQQEQQQGEEGKQDDQQKNDQSKQDEQKPGEPKDQQQKEGQEQQEGEKKEDDSMPSVSDKLKEMNISEEKAKMILDAMRNSEMQYIQQNRRKVTQPRDKSKPDW